MPSASGQSLVTAVLATADAFLRESERIFRPFGLTGAQYNVLNVLIYRPEGMSQRELGDVLVVDRSNVTGLIDRMTKAGWVKRADDPADRRVYRVSLTAAGKRIHARVNPAYLAVVAQVTRGLSADKVEASTEILHELEANASRWNSTVAAADSSHKQASRKQAGAEK